MLPVDDKLLRTIGVSCPIFLAPMGGAGTPELAAAVSNAGGLGALGAAYLTPDQISRDIRQTRALTDKPFNVNLFAGGYEHAREVPAAPMLEVLSEIHNELGLPPPELPEVLRDPFAEQFEAVLDARPAVFSFTFGIPGPDFIRRALARDISIFGTATNITEALMLEQSGVTAIVAQGAEAGAHRGTFSGPFEQAMIPTLNLVREIRRAVAIPVIASGGLMDGRDINVCISAGASAAQLGTAFLVSPESSACEAWKQAILATRTDTTVVTRAFSGRPARGLTNAFIESLKGREDVILPFPLQNALTRTMRGTAARLGRPEFLSLWAGQGVSRARSLPAADLVARLLEEINEAHAVSSA